MAPPVVVWIEVDTLRADVLSCYDPHSARSGLEPLTPNIDLLALRGIRFERAYSVAPWTIPSVATKLTGEWPWVHGCSRIQTRLDPSLPTLAERFRERDWRTIGVMTNFVATQRMAGFGRGFERWDDELATGHEGATSAQAVDRLLAMADEAREEPGQGLFLFALLFDPHFRYEQHPGLEFGPQLGGSYEGALTGEESLPELRRSLADRELTWHDAAFLRGRYLSEVANVDRSIGRLLRGLEELGLERQATIVLTSDHGEQVVERGWIGHTRSLHDELVRIPWIVRLPGGGGRRGTRDAPVSAIDLPATLLELATGESVEIGASRSFAGYVREGVDAPDTPVLFQANFEPPSAEPTAQAKRARMLGRLTPEGDEILVFDRLAAERSSGTPWTRYDLESLVHWEGGGLMPFLRGPIEAVASDDLPESADVLRALLESDEIWR